MPSQRFAKKSFNLSLMLLIFLLIKDSNSNPIDNELLSVMDISQCFERISNTTLEKKTFFYKDIHTMEQCTKLAMGQKYKEDIFFPKYFHKCFPLCNSCYEYSKNKSNMKCISCLNGFLLKEGNCFINTKYDSKKRTKELNIIFNTLNLNPKIKSNEIIKKYINGETYFFKNKLKSSLRKLYSKDDYDDSNNAIFEREDQSTLTNNKSQIPYNFRIELSPYYYLAKRCIEKGKYFIENNTCVDECTPHLERYFGYPEILIPVGPDNNVYVCDCTFRCCTKKMNNLYKSLDRGITDGSYQYYRRPDGRCITRHEPYGYRFKTDHYILAQDYIPCFFYIYNEQNEIEIVISGYEKTIEGNYCENKCPNDKNIYYYEPQLGACYKCPEHCLECNGVPTSENGYCLKCERFYHGIYNGFCVPLCPDGYGEKDGAPNICQRCEENEIKFDNKCVLKKDDNKYGTDENPSYPDENNPKIYHACLEYVGLEKYVINTDSSICPDYIRCPDPFYNSVGKCEKCPTGCESCSETGSNCYICASDYELVDAKCRPCFFKSSDDKCLTDCPDNHYQYFIGDLHKCVIDCPSPFIKTDEHTCQNKCEDGDHTHVIPENLCLLKCNIHFPESIISGCVNCASVGLYNNNGVCVAKEDNFDEIYFILPGEENEKYGMVGSCYIIDELGDYHPEHVKSREYDPSLCPDDCPSNFIKKYDSKGEIYCSKCYETCQTCDYTGVAGNHKCTSCKEGYEPSTRMYGVCDQICLAGEFFYYEDTRERKCSDYCPDKKPYMAEPDDENAPNIECIGDCQDNNQLLMNNTFSCVKECPEGYYIINLTCVDKCPEGTGAFGNNINCIDCNNNSLYYYDGKCYNASEEIPLDTYIEPLEETNSGNDEEKDPIPGDNDDGTFHDCFKEETDELIKTGYYAKYQNCSEICPEGYYYDVDSKYCTKCEMSDDCPYCDPEEGCSFDCPDDYLIVYDDDLSMSCLKNCPEDSPIFDGMYCVDNCPNPDDKMVITYNGKEKNVDCLSINCKDINLYFFPDTNICYESYTIPEDTYYNPDTQSQEENTLSPCLIKISSLEYSTGFFYVLSNCKVQCPENYFYAGDNKCKKCHPLCKTCFDEGTNNDNKCNSCADTNNRILNPYTYNCEKKCDSSFYYDRDTGEMICDEKCEKDQYIDEITGKCINRCRKLIDGSYCVSECPDDKIEFNGYCLKDVNIPVIVKTVVTTVKVIVQSDPKDQTENTNQNNNQNNQQNENQNQNNNQNTYNDNNNSNDNNNNENDNTNDKINGNMDIVEIIRIIKRNLTKFFNWNFLNENNDPENTNNNNNNYKIYQTKDGNISLSELYLNSSFLNLGNSITIIYLSSELKTKLKEKYPSENSFYIMQIDLKEQENKNLEENISPLSKFKLFLTSGEEINIDNLFPDIEIILEKEIKFKNKLENNNELAYDLIKKGINLFDINDPFFNDMCYSYQDENGNDVTLKNRKEDYYQNILICTYGCEYIGINTTNSTNYKIICKCKISALTLKNISEIYDYDKNNLNEVVKYNNDKNIILELVKCTDDISKKEEIKKNMGLWVYLGFLGLLAGLFLCYFCYDFDSLYAVLFPFSKNEKGIKNEEEVIEEEIITKKEIVNSIDNKDSKEGIQSQLKIKNKKNPPKKYRISFDDNKKEYPKLNISNFGKEGYKLSNKFDKINLETISDIDNSPEKNKDNDNNYSSPRNNSSLSNSNSGYNSPSSDSSFNFNQKFSPRQVDLNPEGALLDSNNFFDTCKIVKIPSRFSYQENNETNKKSNLLTLNKNNRNSAFYQNKRRTVRLPGFPSPKIESNESFSDFEGENPINRKKKKIKNEDSLYRRDIKKEIYEKERENIDNLSELDSQEIKGVYHKYKNNNYPYRNRSSLVNSNTTETFSRQPITINKYYITNNSPDDIYNPMNIQDKIKTKNNNYLSNNKKNCEKTVTIRRKKIKTNKTFFSEYISKYDLDFTDFEYVTLYENRSFCQIYFSFLSNFQIFLSVILGGGTGKIFIPWCVRGAIAVFTMELYFTGIALFINFSTLEKRYKFNNTIDILYLIRNEYSSIIYTSLISKIMNVITMYFLVHYSINKVIKEYAFKEDLFLKKIRYEIRCLKCKYHIFFIICMILTILQGYYIYCFCGVFKGAIKPWVFSSLITFGINIIISFLIILISTGLRKIALYCQSWIIFLFSKLILLLA